jgi:hypothetical protein
MKPYQSTLEWPHGPHKRSSIRSTATKTFAACTIALGTTLMLPEVADAKPKKDDTKVKLRVSRGRMGETHVELTNEGKQLLTKYANLRDTLQADLQKQLPANTSNQLPELQRILADIENAQETIKNGEKQLRNFITHEKAVQNVKDAEQALVDIKQTIAECETYLAYAKALPDGHEDKEWVLKEAERTLANRNRDLNDKLPKNLERAKSNLQKAERDKQNEAANLVKVKKTIEDARADLEKARAEGMKRVGDAGLMRLVTSDKLDTDLARFMVINEAHPYWLAAYAQESPAHAERIERLLGDTPLMLRMLVNNGPTWGKFGKAMEIYETIQQTSPRAKDGVFERLALAVSLEHAVPMPESTKTQNGFGDPQTDNTTYVDPVERYLHYEKAWLDGELDHHFDKHDVWSLRMTVDSFQTSEYLAWARQMMRDYRPDLLIYPNESLRYSKVVDEEVQYSSFFLNKEGWAPANLERMQSGLATGGICGLRAHFGGYILTAFGVPTTARGQRGHAALVRFTPEGWVPYLGAGWGSNNREIRGYRSDSDFRASTEARRDPENFVAVKRAQWLGKVAGEEHAAGWGFQKGQRWKRDKKGPPPIEYWNAAACLVQEGLISRLNVNVLDAIGEDIGEADGPVGGGSLGTVEIPASERKASVNAAGVIYLPAAATTRPQTQTENFLFMPSNLGGVQVHFRRYGSGESFEYTVEAPKAGKYMLTSRLVTPAWKQFMELSINGAAPQSIALPYTMGLWGELEPVEVELKQGTNVLTFSRRHHFFRGVSIKDFTLTPVVN